VHIIIATFLIKVSPISPRTPVKKTIQATDTLYYP
jgi:hypothetical protein